ncbi:MAG: cytochrome c [Myxococcales bacterium]|nr:cytochrome c [Myxococcales bacterium]
MSRVRLGMGSRCGLLCGLLFGLLFGLLSACQRAQSPSQDATLDFLQDGVLLRTVSVRTAAQLQRITTFDPYYKKQKTFLAVPLRSVLLLGFAGQDLRREQLVLRSLDGYTVPIVGERLLEDGAFLAVADGDSARWEPIGPQQTDPGPLYLIWTAAHQQDHDSYPRPWQLKGIELARFERLFPHVTPTGMPDDSPARRGFALFRDQCLRCHAINREGGRIGPDLNVPQSIVEYRPLPQIREYITDPLRFRYSNMPAHPHLTVADIDAIVAYFFAMKDRKHDPERRP